MGLFDICNCCRPLLGVGCFGESGDSSNADIGRPSLSLSRRMDFSQLERAILLLSYFSKTVYTYIFNVKVGALGVVE